MRRLFGALSDEGLSCVCGPRAYRCPGVRWGAVGGGGRGAVLVCCDRLGAGLSIICADEAPFRHGIISRYEPPLPPAKRSAGSHGCWRRGPFLAIGNPAIEVMKTSPFTASGAMRQRQLSLRSTTDANLQVIDHKQCADLCACCLSTIRKPGERPPAPRPNNGRAT